MYCYCVEAYLYLERTVTKPQQFILNYFCLFVCGTHVFYVGDLTIVYPYNFEIINLNFHSLEVVPHCGDPHLLVIENYLLRFVEFISSSVKYKTLSHF